MNEWLAARNILAVRMDNIGDVLMLGPALRAIKASSPATRLTLLASPAGTTAAPLLPWIDDVITWRPIWQDVGGRMPFDPTNERELIAQLAERKFDAAIIFTSFSQTPHTPGYVCYLAGIPLRAGESKEFGGSTLTTELRSTPDETHQVERNLRLVETLGFQVPDRRLTVSIPTSARRKVPKLLCEAGIDPDEPFILLHPGASAKARRYPARHFGTVACLLSRHGWQVLITGVERESSLVEEVLQQMPQEHVHVLIGRTTLVEYAAIVERAVLAICNDTLLMHLADAVRTPEVVLFSGTDYEEQWKPRTTIARLLRRPTSCSPCYLFECPIGLPCLDISPEEVAEAVETMLATLAPQGASQSGRPDPQDIRPPQNTRKGYPYYTRQCAPIGRASMDGERGGAVYSRATPCGQTVWETVGAWGPGGCGWNCNREWQ
jgi:lipopolysaccharide heptosyltransferase II